MILLGFEMLRRNKHLISERRAVFTFHLIQTVLNYCKLFLKICVCVRVF